MQLLKRLPVILYWKALVRLIDRKSWIACGKAFHRSSRATNSFNGRLIRHRSGAGGFSLFFSFSFLVWGGKTSVDDTFALGFRPSSAGISSWTQRANAIRNPSSCFSGCSCRSMPLPFGMAGVKWKKWTLSLSLSCPRESVTDEGAVGFWRNKKKNPPNVQLHTQLSVFVRVCEPSL